MAAPSASVAIAATVSTVVGTIAGLLSAGGFGGFVGACAGAFAGVLIGIAIRYRGVRAALGDHTVPSTEGLDPQQRLAILSASAGSAGFASGLLKELGEVRELAREDPARALARTEDLLASHPGSPAVLAELAVRLDGVGREQDAHRRAGEAIARALAQGAGPVAVRVFVQFSGSRERLALDPSQWDPLARILEANGEAAHSQWCREQAGSPPAPDTLG